MGAWAGGGVMGGASEGASVRAHNLRCHAPSPTNHPPYTTHPQVGAEEAVGARGVHALQQRLVVAQVLHRVMLQGGIHRGGRFWGGVGCGLRVGRASEAQSGGDMCARAAGGASMHRAPRAHPPPRELAQRVLAPPQLVVHLLHLGVHVLSCAQAVAQQLWVGGGGVEGGGVGRAVGGAHASLARRRSRLPPPPPSPPTPTQPRTITVIQHLVAHRLPGPRLGRGAVGGGAEAAALQPGRVVGRGQQQSGRRKSSVLGGGERRRSRQGRREPVDVDAVELALQRQHLGERVVLCTGGRVGGWVGGRAGVQV